MNDIKIYLDVDSIEYIHGTQNIYSYATNIYFIIDEKTMLPNRNAIADPVYVLGWLLREMRLSLSSKVKERHLYFNAEQGQYIFLSTENNVLKLRFTGMKKRPSVLRTVVGLGKVEVEEREFCCVFGPFFAETYEIAAKLYDKFKDVYPRGGGIDDLMGELKRSESIVRRFKK